MGKDHTGWTVKRIKRKGFLKTGTGRIWAEAASPKTPMYGLPSGPQIAKNREPGR
jgi:hypothetical protein